MFNLHQNKGAYINLLLFSLIHHKIEIKIVEGGGIMFLPCLT